MDFRLNSWVPSRAARLVAPVLVALAATGCGGGGGGPIAQTADSPMRNVFLGTMVYNDIGVVTGVNRLIAASITNRSSFKLTAPDANYLVGGYSSLGLGFSNPVQAVLTSFTNDDVAVTLLSGSNTVATGQMQPVGSAEYGTVTGPPRQGQGEGALVVIDSTGVIAVAEIQGVFGSGGTISFTGSAVSVTGTFGSGQSVTGAMLTLNGKSYSQSSVQYAGNGLYVYFPLKGPDASATYWFISRTPLPPPG